MKKPWIIILGICLFLLGLAATFAAIIVLCQLLFLTYSMGYGGLVLRLAICTALLLSSIVWLAFSLRGRKKRGKGNAAVYAAIALVASGLLCAYMDFIPTIRDLTAEPVTEACLVFVEQKGYQVSLVTNSYPINRYKMSMLENLTDDTGERVFTPIWIFKPFQKYNFGADYHMTITYYPHSNTRVSVADITKAE